MISKFVLGNELIFYRNKKLYIDKIRELGLSAFMFIENKRYDVFDEEMATATAQASVKKTMQGKINSFLTLKIFGRSVFNLLIYALRIVSKDFIY